MLGVMREWALGWVVGVSVVSQPLAGIVKDRHDERKIGCLRAFDPYGMHIA